MTGNLRESRQMTGQQEIVMLGAAKDPSGDDEIPNKLVSDSDRAELRNSEQPVVNAVLTTPPGHGSHCGSA